MFNKLVIWILAGLCLYGGAVAFSQSPYSEFKRDVYLRQFENNDSVPQVIRAESFTRNSVYFTLFVLWILPGVYMIRNTLKKWMMATLLVLMAFNTTGCGFFIKPFQPIDLQVIQNHEEGFLIPLTGDLTKQTAKDNASFLRDKLINVKQIQVPQQWIATGYQWPYYIGNWKASAILLKVDTAPVTREWTADPASGTSAANQAVWGQSADGVEFSTGWSITARIKDKEGAIQFLSNYPNGTLEAVLDREVRAKVQTEFGIEVTDLPMDIMRKSATPHIHRIVDTVKEFFTPRGITITNLGITGGFIYKNPTIQDKLVAVFNAEQEQNIRKAEFQAQDQKNKTINAAAEGAAKALLTEKGAEAKGIQLVADAKAYEISKAKENSEAYLTLKQLEITKSLISKWNGVYPQYFIGGTNPSTLLQLPTIKNEK